MGRRFEIITYFLLHIWATILVHYKKIMRRRIYIKDLSPTPHMVTKLQISKIVKFRALGWNQQKIADELGLSQQVIAYQLKIIKERAEKEGAEGVFTNIVDSEEESKLLLNELCSWLWDAANILRGPVEHADFKTYLFPLLFLKRINDVWEEERQAAIDQVGADFPENHRFHIPRGARWIDIRSASTDVGQVLQSSMREIEASNPKLEGIFGDAQWTNKERFTDELLKDIIEHFSKYTLGRDVSEGDLVGQAYEWTIKKFADLENKAAGEFYTPRSVIRLMIQILKPQEGFSIYDPACGTGGMLLEAVRYIRVRDGDIRSLYGNLYGQEKNFITSSMARANLYLHGLEDFTIARGDTLLEPAFIEGGALQKFDIVIANPPFSLKNWGQEQWASDRWGRNAYGMPPTKNGDYAWIEHMISSMKKNGRMAVVLPQGALYRMAAEGKIRKKLLEEDLVECIIGLAPNLFYGTGLAASIMILNNKKTALKKGKLLVIDGSNQFWKGRAQNEMREEHGSRILELYEAFDDVEGESKVTDMAELEENDWNLNISRYVLPVSEEDSITLNEAVTNLKQSLNTAWEVEEHLKELLGEAGLLEGLDHLLGGDSQ
jgi:type I restriction enzyme M protein